MSVFDDLKSSSQSTKSQINLAQLKSNPSATLKQMNLNIPEGMNNPRQIINYLIQSGQIGMFGRK